MALISCPECKGKVSDKAPACPHCGYPLESTRTVDEPRQWETCRIEWDPKRNFLGQTYGVHKFWAAAHSPTFGSYSAGRSADFVHTFVYRMQQGNDGPPHGQDKHALTMHQELTARLTAFGWEPVNDIGQYWWQRSFRRPATSEPPEVAPILVSYSPSPDAEAVALPDDAEVTLLTIADGYIQFQVKVDRSKKTAYIPLS